MKRKVISKKLFNFLLSSAICVGTLATLTPQTSYASTPDKNVCYELADNIQDGVTLHCFNWTYKQIMDELPNISAAGFSSVQTSPAQTAVVGNSTWYYLYQPNTFSVGNSGLGSEDDLKKLCSEADKYGIHVIVDVVANHLAGDHSNIDSSLKDSIYWHNYNGSIHYNNRYEITHGNIGMPDINSENSFVQEKVRNYVQQLKADGVDGIRWDAAKHISLPSESCGFWNSVIDNDLYNYGEILDCPVTDNKSFANSLMSEYTDYMSVTDSVYSSNVLGSISNGTVPTCFANWTTVNGIDNNEVVYWAESHDTFSNNTSEGGWTKYINQNTIDRAYAIVASRNGASALYFSRPNQTNKDSIMVGQKGSTHFTSDEVSAVNHFHNACNGEPDYYTTDNNIAVITRESGAVLVLGSGNNKYVSVKNGGGYTTPGTYVDEISGNIFTVTSDTISGTIGSTGIAVFYKLNDTPIDDDPTSDTNTIYFSNNNNWDNVYAYTWGGTTNTSSWPGDKMKYVKTNEFGEAIYKIEIASDVSGLIFNNGNGTKTVDISTGIYDGIGYYITNTNGICTVGTYKYSE